MEFYKKVVVFWEVLIFLFLLCLSLFLLLYYFNEIESSFTHKGIQFLHEKDFVQARENFNESLIKTPFNPWSHINLALSYDFLDAPEKAFKAYNIVSFYLAKKSAEAAFYSYFNKGELYGRLGYLEKALKNYQQALEFKYKEKTIKKNIELLFKHPELSQQHNQKTEQGQERSESGQKPQGQPETGESGVEEEPEDQTEEDESGTGKDSEDQSEKGESEVGKEREDNNQEDSNSEDEPQPFDTEDSQQQDNNKTQDNQNNTSLKGLSEEEQKAILEEIERQENEVRSKFYKRKKTYGDKSKKDW